MSSLRKYLLSSVSHLAIDRALRAQMQSGRSLDAAASAMPSAGGHGKPSSRPLLRANRGGAR